MTDKFVTWCETLSKWFATVHLLYFSLKLSCNNGNFQITEELQKVSSPFQRNRIYPSTMLNIYSTDWHFTCRTS